MRKITVAICGFGNRGCDAYAAYQQTHPEEMQVVAVADRKRSRREDAMKTYGVKAENCFEHADLLLEKEKLADVMIIATQDRDHVPQALKALDKGYDVLLEKPISPELDECVRLARAASEKKRHVAVCHVLRYTAFYSRIKQILESGAIGEIMTMDAVENVGYYHYAHSFVRGNWRRSEETSPMILAKSCHDMDILRYLMDKPCRRVNSYGSLRFFRSEHAPEGSARRCMECIYADSCPYSALRIYMNHPKLGYEHGNRDWPLNVLVHEPTKEALLEEIRTGPYGRCVFRCDNDVVDHQVVQMEFEGGATASFTMSAFTKDCYRTLRVMGTRGEIEAAMNKDRITVRRFDGEDEVIDLKKEKGMSGHGGGDEGIMRSFLALVRGEEAHALTSAEVSVESHVMALAAEHSRRLGGLCVEMREFAQRAAESERKGCTE